MGTKKTKYAFTLIETVIVIVVIDLLISAVFLGRDLILSSAVRSQLSQFQSYQAAVTTFRLKYNYLPGDITDPDATGFGFAPRGTIRGQGDGNGLLESYINWLGTTLVIIMALEKLRYSGETLIQRT